MKRKLSFNTSPASIFTYLSIFAAFGYFLYNCYRLWLFTIDDSYITFRYAANFADGIGPTFNAELPRAEGYTSFLWMLIMTIPHLLNIGPVIFAKTIGIAAALGTMGIITIFIIRASQTEKWVSRLSGGLIILIYALLPETAIHAVSGMETSLYGFCLIGMVYLAYLGIKGNKRALNWLPLIGLTIGLIRPEANILAVIILLVTMKFTNNRLGFVKRIILLYLLPGAVYFIWRYNYYGVLFPLPFYIKTGSTVFPGLDYVRSFLFLVVTNFLILLAFGFFAESHIKILLSTVIIADLLYFLTVNPIMGYDFRFLYPVLPLFLVLAGLGLALLLGSAAGLFKNPGTASFASVWIGIAILVVFMLDTLPRTAPMFVHKQNYAVGLRDIHVKIGQTLAKLKNLDNDPVLVVTDAGAIPYYSGWYTIDAYGLNDPVIALEKQETVSYVFSNDPDVMILTSNDLDTFKSDSATVRNLYNTAVHHGMMVISRRPFYQGDSIWVFARTGSDIAGRLIDLSLLDEN